MLRALTLAGLMLLLCSCAGKTTISDHRELQSTLAELSGKQKQSLESFAALLRVKLSREGKIDDFRVELFSRADSLLSVYIRGFLGKSVLKATLIGDSLTAYFPSDNVGYIGRRQDLETGKLDSAGHIIDFMLKLFSGSLLSPDTANWDFYAEKQGRRLDLHLSDKRCKSNLETRFSTDREQFPHLKLESLYLVSEDGHVKLHLETISMKFNREIPTVKFELTLPPGAERVGKEELGRLLTEVS